MDMDDQVQRDALGVSLFGTQWEDLGTEAMSALADINKEAYNTENALGKINSVRYNNLTDAFEAVKRQAEVSLLPLASTIANAFTKIAFKAGRTLEIFIPIIASDPSTNATTINGTTFSATLAILLSPPRVISAVSAMMMAPRMTL